MESIALGERGQRWPRWQEIGMKFAPWVLSPFLATPAAPAPDPPPVLVACVADAAGGPAEVDTSAPLRTPPHGAPPLLSPRGLPLPPLPTALPRDPTLRTQAGLYATREQAEDLDGESGGDVLWATIDGAGPDALAEAEQRIVDALVGRDLGPDTPVFVSGPDLRPAARLVDRLGARGLTRVYLLPD